MDVQLATLRRVSARRFAKWGLPEESVLPGLAIKVLRLSLEESRAGRAVSVLNNFSSIF